MDKLPILKSTIEGHLNQASNRQKLEIEPLLRLSTLETDIVIAMEKGKKISQMTPNEKVKLVANIMYNAKIRLGHTTPFVDEVQTQKMISIDLAKNFSGLTDMEVLKGITLGLNGEFARENEVIIFSPANIIRWIKKYIEFVKAPAVLKYFMLKESPKSIPSLEEQLTFFKTIFTSDYNKIKHNLTEQGYLFIDYGHTYYNRLEQLGIISLNIESKKQIYREEAARFPNFSNAYIQCACKDRVLREYIIKWINTNTDIESLLDDSIRKSLKDG